MGSIYKGWTRGGGRLLAALLLAAVAACGGDSGDAEGPEDNAVLAGAPASVALSALVEIEPTPAASHDIAGAYLLTRISVVLKPDATVGELNAAAQAVGATAISFSRPGSPFITLAVPRQPSGAALTELARRLESQPGILFASAGRQVELLDLPADEGVAARLDELDYLLATRFPAAWNVRRQALTPEGNCVSTVTVIFPDFFHGKPSGFDAQMEGSIIADPRTTEPIAEEDRQPHGYNTVATLTARFDSQVSTGANPLPKCLKIKLLDGRGLGLVELVDNTIRAVQQAPGRVLLSSSVGYKNSIICGPDGTDKCAEADIAPSAEIIRTHIRDHFVHGILWASFAMRPDVVDRMLIVQAAGNDGSDTIGDLYPVLRNARFGSPFAIATVIGGLDALLADVSLWRPVTAAPELPDLSLDAQTVFYLVSNRDLLVLNPVTERNLVLVGSTTNAPHAESVVKHEMTNDGATLFAVGKDVTTVDLTVKEGTSYAAPQVAGLVSYLWLLEPTLMNRPLQDTIRAIQDNTQSNATLTGIVDAYATILSLDRSVAPMPGTSRMRLGIVDLDGDGDFDLEDLRKFHAAYINSGGLALEPAVPDYSRFDLNGDGFTGGSRTVAMDLDPSTSTQFGARVLSEVFLAVSGVERPFDENAVTDAQALCYYASTALFAGTDLAARDALLGELCPLKLSAVLPASIAGGADLEVSVVAPARGATFVPVANVLVSFAPTCATVDQISGRSDSAGRISVRVTPNTDCTTVSVAITASADVGTPVLARQTVTATAALLSVAGLYTGTVTNLNREGAPANGVTKSVRQSGTRIAVFDFSFGREDIFGLVFELTPAGTLTFLGRSLSRDSFNFAPMRDVLAVTGSLVGGRLQYLMIVTDSEVTDRVIRDEIQHDLRKQP